MADQTLSFNIKINNKDLDLTKTSFKDFQKEVKKAKDELKSLPLNDPRYKQLSEEIKNAESQFDKASKAAKGFGDDMKDSETKTKSYAAQIKEAKNNLVSIEQQFGKNSKQYKDAQTKLNDLKEAQEDLNRASKPLAERFKELGGPIGRVGGIVDAVGDKFSVLKGGLNQMGLGFKSLGQAIMTSGIGAIVILIGLLVAAVIKAASSFEPLQRATEKISIATSMFMDVLKPITDFILGAVVGAMELLAKSIAFVTGRMDEYNKKASAAEATAQLEKNLKKQEAFLDANGYKFDQYTQKKMKANIDYNKKVLEIDKDETLSAKQKEELKVQYRLKANNEIQQADLERKKAEEDAAKQAADEAKRKADEALNRRKGDLDAQIELEIQKENTSRQKLKELLDKRMNLELQQAGLSAAQKELIRKQYEERLNAAITDDDNKRLQKLNDQLDAEIQLEIDKEDTSREKLQALLDKKMNMELAQEGLSEEKKQIIRNKYKKILDESLKSDAEKRKAARTRELDALIEIEIEKENTSREELHKLLMEKMEMELAVEGLKEAEKQRIRDKYRKIEEQALADDRKKLFDKRMKAFEEELFKMDEEVVIKNEHINKAYADRALLIDERERKELSNVNLLESEKEAIREKFRQLRKTNDDTALKQQEAYSQAQMRIQDAVIQNIGALGAFLSQVAGKNKKLQIAGLVAEKAAAIANAVVSTNRAILSNRAAVAILPPPLNVTLDRAYALQARIGMGISIASIIASAAKGVSEINAADTEQEKPPAPKPFTVTASRYQGGMISGPGTSQSDSILARVSNGEFVMNARSTANFLPILESMNDMGNQPQLAAGGFMFAGKRRKMQQLIDKVKAEREKRIAEGGGTTKAYVVSTEVTNRQQLDRMTKMRSII